MMNGEALPPNLELVSDCMGDYDERRVAADEAEAIPLGEGPGSVRVFAALVGGSTFALGMIEVPFKSAMWEHPARSIETVRAAYLEAREKLRTQEGADAIVFPMDIDEVDGHIGLAVGFKVCHGAARSSIKAQLERAFLGIEELCGV